MLQSTDIRAVAKGFLLDPVGWLKARPLLLGSALFFASTTLVNLGNYLFNLILGRWLGPSLFADLSLIVTLMLVITFATTAFMTATAKFAAAYVVDGGPDRLAALRSWLGRRALLLGGLLMLLLVLGAPFLASIFHMRSPWPFVILGVGLPIFFAMAIDRGVLQGQARFGWLAASNQAEMWVRLLGAIALVALGLSVNGAVAGLTLSFIAAWLVALSARQGLPTHFEALEKDEQRKIWLYFSPVIMGLMGQIIINNSDVLIVKGYFPDVQAGLYAALALIGRMVFFATWSVVMVMFPLVTQRYQRREPHRPLLWLSLGIVAIVSLCILGATLFMPGLVVGFLFGPAFLPIAPLLWLYALATAFYALANVVVTYHLSLGHGQASFLVLVAGVMQVLALLTFHSTLFVVVLVQACIMAGLLFLLVCWDQYCLRTMPSMHMRPPD